MSLGEIADRTKGQQPTSLRETMNTARALWGAVVRANGVGRRMALWYGDEVEGKGKGVRVMERDHDEDC